MSKTTGAATRPELNRTATYSGHTHFVEFLLRNPSRGGMTLTMSEGQWDQILQIGYDTGARLVEVNDDECVVATYQKGGAA